MKLLSALLDESSVKAYFGDRYTTYLKVILTEEMGLNLRNNVCHGMMESHELSSFTSAILLHVLTILGLGGADDFKPITEGAVSARIE